MSNSLHQLSRDYRALIQRLNTASPGYQGLHDFVNIKQDTCQVVPKFTIITIKAEDHTNASGSCVEFRDFQGTEKLEEALLHLQARTAECNLFLVENVCPETIALLGGYFDINPQFFADHVKNGDWFKDYNLMDQLPALPSSQKWHDFLQVRFIQTLTVSKYPYSSFDSGSKSTSQTSVDVKQDPTRDYLDPDETITRLPRKAGKLKPLAHESQDLDLLLCTKQNITTWMGKRGSEDEGKGWNGILLIDAPFKLPPGRSYCLPPVYRSFMRRPTLADPSIGDIGPHPTNRTALIRHQKERLSSAEFRKLARSDCFFVLGDLYQLAASNWIVINEYILQEMTAIEYKLERNEDDFQDLEFYLKELYVHRRRITRYQELIKETKEQCSERGPRAWPRNEMSEIAAEQAQDWGNDFSSLHVWFYDTSQRIEKNIRLLTALVAITEGKQSLVENHGIARLSLLAMVFLPFSSVATILGMQGSFAPGDRKFWLFWVVGIALTTFVVGLFLLYDRLAQFVRRLKFSAAAKRRDERKSRGVIPDEEHKLPSVYH